MSSRLAQDTWVIACLQRNNVQLSPALLQSQFSVSAATHHTEGLSSGRLQ
jgi:hypothetical protein